MTYSVCTHTRDFDGIYDFIEYHLNLGFDKIIIYDNCSVNPVVYDSNKVEIIHWEHELVNCNTYNHYIKNCTNSGWTAFLDEDEFINTNQINIKEVMKKFEDFDSLALSWRLFGDKIDSEDSTETKFYKKYKYHVPSNDNSSGINSHIKTICKNHVVENFSITHYPNLKQNYQNKNVKGDIVRGAFSEVIHDVIWVDHFHCRGLEDYIKRKSIKIKNSCPTIEVIKENYLAHNEAATQKLQF